MDKTMRIITIITILMMLPFVCRAQDASTIDKAKNGDPSAQATLGAVHINNGDYKQGFYWCRKAAEQGHATAQFLTGHCYYKGQGVEQDFKQATYWFRKAAEQDEVNAQQLLGVCYFYGQGVPEDWSQAKFWWGKAAAQGNDDAYHALEQLYQLEDQSESSELPIEEANNLLEQMPSFPGGVNALIQYLSNNIHYPVKCEKQGITGRVLCSFVVGSNGKITDVTVTQSAHPLLDREAVRVIRSMPKWNPGKKDGKPVRVRYSIPINFNL